MLSNIAVVLLLQVGAFAITSMQSQSSMNPRLEVSVDGVVTKEAHSPESLPQEDLSGLMQKKEALEGTIALEVTSDAAVHVEEPPSASASEEHELAKDVLIRTRMDNKAEMQTEEDFTAPGDTDGNAGDAGDTAPRDTDGDTEGDTAPGDTDGADSPPTNKAHLDGDAGAEGRCTGKCLKYFCQKVDKRWKKEKNKLEDNYIYYNQELQDTWVPNKKQNCGICKGVTIEEADCKEVPAPKEPAPKDPSPAPSDTATTSLPARSTEGPAPSDTATTSASPEPAPCDGGPLAVGDAVELQNLKAAPALNGKTAVITAINDKITTVKMDDGGKVRNVPSVKVKASGCPASPSSSGSGVGLYTLRLSDPCDPKSGVKNNGCAKHRLKDGRKIQLVCKDGRDGGVGCENHACCSLPR